MATQGHIATENRTSPFTLSYAPPRGENCGHDHGHGSNFESWGLPAWDFDTFHRQELPKRLAEGLSEKIAWDVKGVPPFAIALPDERAWSYVSADGQVQVEEGIRPDAACVLEIEEHAWQNYANEFRTPAALILEKVVRFRRGGMLEWDAWAPAINAMYIGREIYDPAKPLFDRDGKLLDLHRKFRMDDDRDEMAHFFRTAGFIVIKGAMKHRLAALRTEFDRLVAAATPGNKFSWWTKNLSTGKDFPYRLRFISEYSDLVRELMDEDETVREIVALAGDELVPLHDRQEGAISVLKPFGHGEKLAPSTAGNLDWHTDCGLGACHITCPSVNVGIHLTDANEDGSRLWVMAGTTGKAFHSAAKIDPNDPHILPLNTEAGDVTLHYSCTLHAGPPPTGANQRRTVYLPFYRPETLELLDRFEAFQEILPGYQEGTIPYAQDVAEELGSKSRYSNVDDGWGK